MERRAADLIAHARVVIPMCWTGIMLVALLLSALPPALAAQTPSPPSDPVARDAISRLRSPYCPGLMLEVCPSPQAQLLRDSIHDLAAQGESADAIVEWMLARHGEEWRAVPKRSGVGLWAWIIPPAVLLAGALLIAAKLRGLRARSEPPRPQDDHELSVADEARIDAALRDWERAEARDS